MPNFKITYLKAGEEYQTTINASAPEMAKLKAYYVGLRVVLRVQQVEHDPAVHVIQAPIFRWRDR